VIVGLAWPVPQSDFVSLYQETCDNRMKKEIIDDNGNETWWMKMEDKETELDRDLLREDTEEHEEANDVENREEKQVL